MATSIFSLPPLPENVLYEFHKYWTAPTQATIQQYLDFRDKHNVPLWLGESGETDDKWIQSFVGLLKDNQIGGCFWRKARTQCGRASTGILGKILPAMHVTTINAMIAITDPMDNPTNAVLKTESR
jgi:hypothetical protein